MEIKTDEKQSKDLGKPIQQDMITSVIEENAKKTNDVKATIDLVATKTALSKEETVEIQDEEISDELEKMRKSNLQYLIITIPIIVVNII